MFRRESPARRAGSERAATRSRFCEPHPKAWRLDGNNVRFPKLGTLRTVMHRPLEGKPKTCTLKRDGDQWFASDRLRD